MRVPAERWRRKACSGILETPHSSTHSSVCMQGFFPAALIHSASQASHSVYSRVIYYLESIIGSFVARIVGSKI